MSTTRPATAQPLQNPRGVAIAVAVAMGGSAVYLGHRSGVVVGLLAVALEAVALLLIGNARLALLALFVLGVVAEDDPTWGVNLVALYNHGTAQPSPFEALELLAITAALLYLTSSRLQPRSPRPFGIPLLVLLAAVLAGIAQGLSNGANAASSLLGTVETTLPLLLVPLVVVNVVRSERQLRAALAVVAGLAAFKAVAGLFVLLSGLATVQGSFGRITYFQAPANLLMMLFLLGSVGAMLARFELPGWVRWMTPVVFAALLLSFRRTIWLGTVAALPVVLFVASGRIARRFVVPAAVLVAAVGYLMLSTGIGGGLRGSLVTRAESISLSKISQNQEDRYRIDERHNVWIAIKRNPITGLGIGVPWPVRYSVGVEFKDQNQFAHVAVLFWWMKMGLLGMLAYLSLIATAIFIGFKVWRRHHDPLIRAFGLGAAGLTVGLAIVEVANTVLGASERGGMLFGAIIGLLAVANTQLRSQPGPQSADTLPAR